MRGAAFSTSYTYDSVGRLQQGQTNDLTAANTWQLAWTYDRYGNRLSQSLTGGTLSVGQPQLVIDPATNHISSSGFTYDANGNLKQDPAGSYTFDADNRMTQSVVGSTTASYSYDGSRLRVQKTSGTTTTTYVFSGTKAIAEYANGSLSKEYIYSGSKLLATIAGTAVTYHHPDHLSNRVETDPSGVVTRTSSHLLFGDVWYETGTPDKWKFTSYERDPESGLDYAIHRYYSSGYGRFISADLLPGSLDNPQLLNRYSYVANDPMNMADPLGLHLFLVTSTSLCSFSVDESGKITNVDCTLISQTITDLEPGTDDDRGPAPLRRPTKPSLSRKTYEDCAKKAFGATQGQIPGTPKSIPSYDVASLVFDASTLVGVNPGLVGATMAIESNSDLAQPNSDRNRNGSVDIGPMQLNTNMAGQPGAYPIWGDAMGTNLGPFQAFNGDPFANIVTGANYLRMLGKHPERYVGQSADRQGLLDSLLPSMNKFFDCIRKGLGLKK